MAALRGQEHSFTVLPLKVYWSAPDYEGGHAGSLKTAFIVPKKTKKRAVDRNRIKRQMREALRKNIIPLRKILDERGICMDAHFVWIGRDSCSFQQLENKIILSLQRLSKEAEKMLLAGR